MKLCKVCFLLIIPIFPCTPFLISYPIYYLPWVMVINWLYNKRIVKLSMVISLALKALAEWFCVKSRFYIFSCRCFKAVDVFLVCLWRTLVQSTGPWLPAQCMTGCQNSTAQCSWGLAPFWSEGTTQVVSEASLCHICPELSVTCCSPWYRHTLRSIQTKYFPSIFHF